MDADERSRPEPGTRATYGLFADVPGEDLGRLLALSDGVFAFALTLLVLSLTVPSIATSGLSSSQVSRQLFSALSGDWHVFLGYVFCFAMIAIWWMAHHRTFRHIVRYDRTLIRLNLLLLLEIAVMPFVLEVYVTYSGTQTAVVLFAVTQAVAGLTLNSLLTYATTDHRLVPSSLDTASIRRAQAWGWVTPVVFLASVGISFLSVDAAQYSWVAVFLVQRLGGRYVAS